MHFQNDLLTCGKNDENETYFRIMCHETLMKWQVF